MEASIRSNNCPATPDKWQSLPILICAGCFADEHDATRGVAVGEYRVGGKALEFAAFEIRQRLFQLGKRCTGGGDFFGAFDRRPGHRRSECGRNRAPDGSRRLRSRLPRNGWRRGQKPVDGEFADGFIGAGFDQPTQGCKSVFSGQTGHWFMV